jgi:hypothetical protein
MQPITGFHPPYTKDGQDFSLLGELIHSEDANQAYGHDEARLFKQGRRYNLIAATGCSCWDGEWEGWGNLTLAELRKLGKSWAGDGGSPGLMGEYILESL